MRATIIHERERADVNNFQVKHLLNHLCLAKCYHFVKMLFDHLKSVLYLSLFDMFCEDVRTRFESIAFLFLYLSVI